jgi:hypothetical protein
LQKQQQEKQQGHISTNDSAEKVKLLNGFCCRAPARRGILSGVHESSDL